ncbi:MAG: hypothetical protein RI842_03865 [Schleiferiaceae bacterium]|nr:hypothetical protein [Schleiferiaceae bacterium]
MKISATSIRGLSWLSVFLLTGSALFPLAGEAQKNCTNQYPHRVTAQSGLSLRSRPSLEAKVLTYGLYKDTMYVCPSAYGTLTVEGIDGHWRRVRYKKQWGYAFDGFLAGLDEQADEAMALSLQKSRKLRQEADSLLGQSSAPPEKSQTAQPLWNNASKAQVAIEAVNYCGPADKLDPSLIWYGIYPADSNARYHRVKPVEMRMVVSQRQLYEGMEFDITTDREERSLFLLGLNRPLATGEVQLKDRSEMFRYRGNQLLPGQIWGLRASAALDLMASGSVNREAECLQVSDYELEATLVKENEEITKQDLMALLPDLGPCGVMELFWYGDLSGDGLPELILVHSPQEGVNQFHLLTSNAPDALWQRAFTFTLPNCE